MTSGHEVGAALARHGGYVTDTEVSIDQHFSDITTFGDDIARFASTGTEYTVKLTIKGSRELADALMDLDYRAYSPPPTPSLPGARTAKAVEDLRKALQDGTARPRS